MKTYQAPKTEVCLLNTKDPHMIGADPDENTSTQLGNSTPWDVMFDGLDEGLDKPSSLSDGQYPSRLWDE